MKDLVRRGKDGPCKRPMLKRKRAGWMSKVYSEML